MSKNGEQSMKFDELDYDGKLGVIHQQLLELLEQQDSMIEKQDQLDERLAEMNEVGTSYNYNRYDN